MAVIRKRARPTLTAVEMDVGDTLEFTLAGGEVRRMALLETHAAVLRSDLPEPGVEKPGCKTDYEFTCRVEVEGEEHRLWREASTQRSFYEPWEIGGLRVWFDAVDAIFEFLTETHGACRPRKAARFAVQDASLAICPEPVYPWCPLPPGGLNIADCYNGEDCWLGAYGGTSAHGGLDINHPAGTPIFAPFDLDDHYLFDSVHDGAGNNRWRGTRRWEDGSAWTIQVHHVIRILVPKRTPVKAGTQMARGAGVAVGSHEHSHFVFAVTEPGERESILLDPWILFRQMYLDQHGRGD